MRVQCIHQHTHSADSEIATVTDICMSRELLYYMWIDDLSTALLISDACRNLSLRCSYSCSERYSLMLSSSLGVGLQTS